MQHLADKIRKVAENRYPEILEIRRHLHRYPERSGEELQTAAFISKTLTQWGIAHKVGIAGAGIVALLSGRNPGKRCIALRADMDALPITEQNTVNYASQNHGVMHACGHDVHMASLLGTMRILNQLKQEFEGEVKCIFQPSEEKYPGGAIQMIQAGVLTDPAPASIFGQHVYPDIPAGKVGFRPGKYMASTDEIFITIKGRGGHAASPHQNIDPVVIGAQVVIALQQITSRMNNPGLPMVLSFGRFTADGRTNIIPDEARLEGTLRTFDENRRTAAHEAIRKIASGTAESFGAECEVFIDKGYPFLFNNEELTLRAAKQASAYLCPENVELLDIRMTAEDFAYFAREIPGCFYRLGTARQNAPFTPLHSAGFDVDENSLITGSGLMAWLAVSELHKPA